MTIAKAKPDAIAEQNRDLERDSRIDSPRDFIVHRHMRETPTRTHMPLAFPPVASKVRQDYATMSTAHSPCQRLNKTLGDMRASRTAIIFSAAPGLLALGLFYSLAIHMLRALGGWPAGIGEAGFPPALAVHANLATNYFWMTLAVSIFTLPIAILVCLFVSRLRHLVPYFALYALVFIISIALMQFAPEPFLYWWRD